MRQTSKVSQQVLGEYNEMIQDTVCDLKVHLQQIDEKMARFPAGNSSTSDISIDLKDERAVTKQCLLICEDAKSYIESLSNRESALLQEAPQNVTEDDTQSSFEAQLLTRQIMDQNRDSFAEIIGRLQERLRSLLLNGEPGNDNERLRLQKDIDISKQCLEVCKVASEVSHQKIYRVGEAIADGDSDQVVITTLADLFHVKIAKSTGNSAQLIGSTTEDTLRHIIDKRYSSRFGASASDPVRVQTGTTTSPSVPGTQKSKNSAPPQAGNDEQLRGPDTRPNRPSPNEMRKRTVDSDNGTR